MEFRTTLSPAIFPRLFLALSSPGDSRVTSLTRPHNILQPSFSLGVEMVLRESGILFLAVTAAEANPSKAYVGTGACAAITPLTSCLTPRVQFRQQTHNYSADLVPLGAASLTKPQKLSSNHVYRYPSAQTLSCPLFCLCWQLL